MTARSRLERDAAVEAVVQLEDLAAGRPATVERLRRLGEFLSAQPPRATEFALGAAAQAVHPGDGDSVAAFREFRRTVSDLAAKNGVEVAIVVDGQKRAADSTRIWWIEGIDATDRKLSELSDASTSAVLDTPVIPALGRSERDGKTVVRTYFDVAPADGLAAERCIDLLRTRLRSDPDYFFERLSAAPLGEDLISARAKALSGADLVVVFLSPAYLKWCSAGGRRVGDPLTVARVVPVCWSRLTGRNDIGPYASRQVFVPKSRAADDVPSDGVPGLDRLRAGPLDDEMARLHTRLTELLASPPKEPAVDVLARHLAASDEPYPVTAWGVKALLDKGVGAATATGPAVDVVEHLVGWATSGDRPYFVVFGEYGMGKTVAAQTLTRELLARRESDPTVPLPIYFDLRLLGTDVRKRDAALDELLADLIKRAWRTGGVSPSVSPDDVITAVQRRRALVIFDGLDEVLVHMSEQQGQGLLRELLRSSRPSWWSGTVPAATPAGCS